MNKTFEVYNTFENHSKFEYIQHCHAANLTMYASVEKAKHIFTQNSFSPLAKQLVDKFQVISIITM